MTISTNLPIGTILTNVQAIAKSARAQAVAANTALASGNVSTGWTFRMLDQLRQVITTLNAYVSVTALNAYATANIPGYTGTMTADIAAVQAAAQGCINWVVNNFPKDSTNTYLLGETLNADGSRTERQFTPAQTAGLQTAVQTLIDTIN